MYLLPTVQVTPRGLWGRSGRSAFMTLAAWLGQSEASDPGHRDARHGGAAAERAVPSAQGSAAAEHATAGDQAAAEEDLALRYLAAFGPASAADLRTWSGLPRSAEVLARLRPRLRTFRDASGRELLDLPDAPLPDPGTPAPVRFLPEYDNLLLAHADRRRIVPEALRAWTEVGWGSVLVDGFVAARWRRSTEEGVSVLRVESFTTLASAASGDVVREGQLLLAILGSRSGGEDGEVRLLDRSGRRPSPG